MIPTPLLLSIAAGREGIPFPAVVEALLMELAFEVLREPPAIAQPNWQRHFNCRCTRDRAGGRCSRHRQSNYDHRCRRHSHSDVCHSKHFRCKHATAPALSHIDHHRGFWGARLLRQLHFAHVARGLAAFIRAADRIALCPIPLARPAGYLNSCAKMGTQLASESFGNVESTYIPSRNSPHAPDGRRRQFG